MGRQERHDVRMDFLNTTRNQHFISRAELSLNAINPSAAKRNQRIHSLAVQDREAWLLRLEHPRGMSIGRALSRVDLFTFDIPDSKHRANLEASFRRYEETIAGQSRVLLRMVETGEKSRIKEVLQSIFVAKLLNFLRNPFCVRKVLSTIGPAAEYSPTDPELHAAYSRVLAGNKPHKDAVCAAYGLGPEDYEKWLNCLFVLLAVEVPDEGTILDMALGQLFATAYVQVAVYSYIGASETQVCLLSDRGFNTPWQDARGFSVNFNISARMFVRFVFVDPGALFPEGARARDLAALMSDTEMSVTVFDRDLDALCNYNRLTVYQCAERVFSASPAPHGLTVN